ncbi:MAG: GcrA cell cycle regulator [Mesorhizobium sp.]|uniref:GcrA family cell cycle regulator n=1 Tax=Mesorhizobium sp. TaxID=1871066 RepID=UPI000FD2AE05|nr:GcrA family cell cycle regulator [Mesorhizobium sp.]RUX06655.1 GcrA cell cycle regulator [Mesorhizobium sp. M8A.F.Ca.ET.059.01.1.1]RWC86299.1 MAG: GcrA cell cycle regulator [Mesorhizobium sp.]TIU48476.1 MAG: GcrA cell cycle regulator [Mesorhizobium sp.]
MASYSDRELQAIAGWLRDGLSASRIAAAFSVQRGARVSRNAIIGIVHRNAMLGAIGFANGKGLAARTAMAKAASRAAKAETSRAGATPQPAKPAMRPKRAPSPVRPRLFQREAGVLIADGQTYRFKVPAPPRGAIGRQPHGVAMRFIDCLFNRCRAPLDLTLEDDPRNDAPGGRPGQEMLCCGMRTRAMKSYCTYHQARFQRRVCEAG